MALLRDCQQIARLLEKTQLRVVFAESCTAGLVSASLGRVPGISEHLCGSAVTYRDHTKAQWLGVPHSCLLEPGAVSEVVARSMAEGVLERTPEADIAMSVTGHLGPRAPGPLDGLIFVGWSLRTVGRGLPTAGVRRFRLTARGRYARQQEAAKRVLMCLRRLLREA